jgi:hypothetical protein
LEKPVAPPNPACRKPFPNTAIWSWRRDLNP